MNALPRRFGLSKVLFKWHGGSEGMPHHAFLLYNTVFQKMWAFEEGKVKGIANAWARGRLWWQTSQALAMPSTSHTA